MPRAGEKADSIRMRKLFATVAPRYDFITRAFSYGMDATWKAQLVNESHLKPGSRILDLACGTGDFSRLAEERGCHAVGADLTLRMLEQARLPRRVCADAMRLPFPDGCFDAVFIGYGVRNFPQMEPALDEIRRVLRPQGALATLDFFLPANAVWRRLFVAYLWVQGAFWGLMLHGRPRIYTYIPRSLAEFLSAAEFAGALEAHGFGQVCTRRFAGGGIALHWAVAS